jgi:preprotein translocase subunit SecA
MIEKAQKRIENNNYGIRRNLLDFDQVNNEQREIIYKERRKVLDGESMRDVIVKMIKDTIDEYVDMAINDDAPASEWDLTELNQLFHDLPLGTIELTDEEIINNDKQKFKDRLFDEAMAIYESKEEQVGEDENGENRMREVERVFLLRTIDRKWMDHIDDMDQLRQGIGLQSYGHRDPVVEYKFTGYDMFNAMTDAIRHDTATAILNVRIEEKVEREEVAKVTGTNKDASAMKEPVKRKEAKIGRNDPCPCGSGKKYKMCCGR